MTPRQALAMALEMPVLRFTRDHEWVRMENDIATVGITPFAQEKLGDLVYIELPEVGTRFEKGTVAATVESVKAASDVYAPLAGDVTAINDRLAEQPGLVNDEPTGNGWLFKMKPANPAEIDALLDEVAYTALTSAESH
jgi:glycine cleavage system H protein